MTPKEKASELFSKIEAPICAEEIHYPLYIKDKGYDKLLVIQSFPEQKIWLKDNEITMDEFIEKINKL